MIYIIIKANKFSLSMRIFEIRHQLTKFNEDVMLFKLIVSNRDHLLYNLLNKSTFFARCIFQDVGRRVEEDKSCTYVAIVLKYIYIYIFFIFLRVKDEKKNNNKVLTKGRFFFWAGISDVKKHRQVDQRQKKNYCVALHSAVVEIFCVNS